MKIRKGFVSNSSSSSFIIGCKGELTREKIGRALGTPPEESIYRAVHELLIDKILELAEPKTLEDGVSGDCHCDPLLYQKIADKGMNIFDGSVSDHEGSIELLICDYLCVAFEDEEIIFHTEERN